MANQAQAPNSRQRTSVINPRNPGKLMQPWQAIVDSGYYTFSLVLSGTDTKSSFGIVPEKWPRVGPFRRLADRVELSAQEVIDHARKHGHLAEKGEAPKARSAAPPRQHSDTILVKDVLNWHSGQVELAEVAQPILVDAAKFRIAQRAMNIAQVNVHEADGDQQIRELLAAADLDRPLLMRPSDWNRVLKNHAIPKERKTVLVTEVNELTLNYLGDFTIQSFRGDNSAAAQAAA